jgi:SOS-response transcriptional repressor LexA
MNNTNKLPTKQQQQILIFINDFITKHGYSPTYREIKKALNYSSISIVAKHINNLIEKGLVRKKPRSARSLEIVDFDNNFSLKSSQISIDQEKWLIEKIDNLFHEIEDKVLIEEQDWQAMLTMIDFLRLLKLDQPIINFTNRYNSLKKKNP